MLGDNTMKIRLRNVLPLSFSSVALLLLFIPGYYKMQLFICGPYGPPGGRWYGYTSSSGDDRIYSFIQTFSVSYDVKPNYIIVGVLLIGALLYCLSLYIVRIVSPQKMKNIIFDIITILPIILMFVYTPIANYFSCQKQNKYPYPEYTIYPLFYVVLALLISSTLISIISRRIDSTSKNKANDSNNNMSQTTEEIKKLKELLDMGAITQEEFDLKKNKLLNL